MPEAGIGFFPDVGGGYFLPRCPGETGTYLALTSKRIKAFDTLYIGFATHFVPALKIGALADEIAKTPQRLESLLKECAARPPEDSEIAPYRDRIDGCFGHNHVEDIMGALEKDASPWAAETIRTMQGLSPTSLKIALRQIRLGARMDFAEVMTMEYRLSQACIARPDFYEGVRAALIDKDRTPRWAPARVQDVSEADIDACFQSLGTQDLVLQSEVHYNQKRI
jgi:enoyl-CoA hydratase